MLLDRQVEGMIFVSCEMTNLSGEHDHYARLLAEGARIVFVNGGLNTLDIPSVGVDERAAAELATQHLLDLGHTCIAFASGPSYYLPAREKQAGWQIALLAAGVAPDGNLAHDDFTVAGGVRAARALLKLDARADGDHLLERPDGDRRAAGGAPISAFASRRISPWSASTGSRRRRGRTRP